MIDEIPSRSTELLFGKATELVPIFSSEQNARVWLQERFDAMYERYDADRQTIIELVQSWTDWEMPYAHERLSGGYRLWLEAQIRTGENDLRVLVEHLSDEELVGKFAGIAAQPSQQEIDEVIRLALSDINNIIIEPLGSDDASMNYSVIAGERPAKSKWTSHVSDMSVSSVDKLIDDVRRIVAIRRAEADTGWHAYRDAYDHYQLGDPAERDIHYKTMSDVTHRFVLHFSDLYTAYEHLEEYYYQTFSWDDPELADAVQSVLGLDAPPKLDAPHIDIATKRMSAWLGVRLGDLENFTTAINTMKQITDSKIKGQI